MNEDQAREWIREKFGVSREALLANLVEQVLDEATRQNLVSPASIAAIWSRHIVDSAQLLRFVEDDARPWLDIGTGAGFPGLAIACLRNAPITLCEPRRRRAEFLESAAAALGVADHVTVAGCKVERLSGKWPLISARAVSALHSLFAAAEHVSDRETLWVLPKGRGAREEVAAARKTWHGSFHVEQSITNSDSYIVVASDVRRR
ncbi:MAG: 16S rRNA (guanine(527)-N(7))-methyltransferase RsmG [Sphingomonas sp.]